jgi:hypothetical protein
MVAAHTNKLDATDESTTARQEKSMREDREAERNIRFRRTIGGNPKEAEFSLYIRQLSVPRYWIRQPPLPSRGKLGKSRCV